MSLSTTLASIPDSDDARIDADSLRRAREERGLSVSEAARWLTLSNSQVAQIEEGGCSAFYSPAHKALAVRKYASAFGLDPEAVLGFASAAGVTSIATDAKETVTAEALATAPSTGTSDDEGALPAPQAQATPMPRARSVNFDMRASAGSLFVGLLLFCAIAIAFAIIRGWLDRFAVPAVVMAATPGLSVSVAEPEPVPVLVTVPVPVHRSDATDAAPAASSDEAGCAAGAAGGGIPQWMPPYVRKPSTRLHISGPSGSEVCVADSRGTVSRLVLRAGTMQAVDGFPPYLVQSTSLDTLQMFMQGLKVKTPLHSDVIRLLPGEHLTVPGTDTALPVS